MWVSVKNTFLDTEFSGLQALTTTKTRRAKSTGPVWPPTKDLTTLEQATLDSLNGLLGHDTSLSNSSLGAMCAEGWDGEKQCGLYSAADRAAWVVLYCGISLEKARLRVMQEFPVFFGRGRRQSCTQTLEQGAVCGRSLSTTSSSTVSVDDWDGERSCDGFRADDRVQWVVEKCGLSLEKARLRVMKEFPAQFDCPMCSSGLSEEEPLKQVSALKRSPSSSSVSTVCPDEWDPEEQCGLYSAEERATWVVTACGLSLDKARSKVMHEFPTQFGSRQQQSSGSEDQLQEQFSALQKSSSNSSEEDWDSDEPCDGYRAEDRAQWVVQKYGFPLEKAQLRVMREFPGQFSRRRHQSGISDESSKDQATEQDSTCEGHIEIEFSMNSQNSSSLESWECTMQCGLYITSGERATWLVQNRKMSLEEARAFVMQEFPNQFGRQRCAISTDQQLPAVDTIFPEHWDCEAFCEGYTAGDRARWVVSTSGLPLEKARLRVMFEFPELFAHRTSQQLMNPVPALKDYTHSHVPKPLNLAQDFSKTCADAPPTTVMIRHVPNRYSQKELVDELGRLGFENTFDFLYAPLDFKTMKNVGYVFVNFVNYEWVMRCQRDLEGYTFRKHQQKSRMKFATVSIAHLQGLEANLRHYEQSAVAKRAISKRLQFGPIILTESSSTTLATP